MVSSQNGPSPARKGLGSSPIRRNCGSAISILTSVRTPRQSREIGSRRKCRSGCFERLTRRGFGSLIAVPRRREWRNARRFRPQRLRRALRRREFAESPVQATPRPIAPKVTRHFEKASHPTFRWLLPRSAPSHSSLTFLFGCGTTRRVLYSRPPHLSGTIVGTRVLAFLRCATLGH